MHKSATDLSLEGSDGASRTVTAILDAAEFLFLRQGFHGTSMRQLARYAGVSPASIYNHFPSKEDLLVTVLRERLPHRDLALAVSHAEGGAAYDLLLDAIRRMRGALEGRFDHLRLAFIEVLEFEGRHLPMVLPELLAPAQSFVARLRASDPRMQSWPPLLILKVVVGGFFALAATRSFLEGVGDMAGDPSDFDGLASILAAGLLHGARPVEGVP